MLRATIRIFQQYYEMKSCFGGKKKINKNFTFLDNRVKNVPTLSDECLSDTADEKLRTYLCCVALQGHTELKTKTYGQFSSVDAIKMRVETLFFDSHPTPFIIGDVGPFFHSV